MSIESITWALRDAPDVPGNLVSTLLVYAYRADNTGCGAHPGIGQIMQYIRRDESTAKRNVRELVKLGLLRRGDQSRAAYIRADRRPVVYDLAVERVRTFDTESAENPPTLFDSMPDEVAPTPPREEVNGGSPTPPRDPYEVAPTPPREIGSNPSRGGVGAPHGGAPTPPERSTKRNPLPLSRSQLLQTVLDGTGWEEEEARNAIEQIKTQRHPKALSRYIAALIESGDIEAFGPAALTPTNGHRPAPPDIDHPYDPDRTGQACQHPGCGLPARRHQIRPIHQGATP